MFGDLLVTYSVQSADPATLALASGTSLLSFYTNPTPNSALPSSEFLQILVAPLNDCATACLSNQACQSFSHLGSNCELYFTAASQGVEPLIVIGADYYEKIQEMVSLKNLDFSLSSYVVKNLALNKFNNCCIIIYCLSFSA